MGAYFAKCIHDARVAAGMTQQQLAEAIGTKQHNISRLEYGGHAVKEDTLEAIAKALGISIGELVSEKVKKRHKVS